MTSLRQQAVDEATHPLVEALEWYANPDIYKPHPHGPAFDDRDLSFIAKSALAQHTGAQSSREDFERDQEAQIMPDGMP